MFLLKIITWITALYFAWSWLISILLRCNCCYCGIRNCLNLHVVLKSTLAIAIYWNVLVLVICFSRLSVFNLWWMMPLTLVFIRLLYGKFLECVSFGFNTFDNKFELFFFGEFAGFDYFYNKFWGVMFFSGVIVSVLIVIAFLLN